MSEMAGCPLKVYHRCAFSAGGSVCLYPKCPVKFAASASRVQKYVREAMERAEGELSADFYTAQPNAKLQGDECE